MSDFKLTEKQEQAMEVLSGPATHGMLFGGSRSGKTFLLVRNTILRALKASRSRHAILRYRFNHIKASIILDTFPKVMRLCFPGVEYELSKTDWYARLPNDSEIWFGGLDDKERTEKILGQEYATLYFNECSQLPYGSVAMAITRLAQLAEVSPGQFLIPRAFYDMNPTDKTHWAYKLFIQKVDPETKKPLPDPENYVSFRINPEDNIQNLSANYLATLQSLSPRLQRRFLRGEFSDGTPNALFSDEKIETWRVTEGNIPDLGRGVGGVDPSGSGDDSGTEADAIGIVVAGLGTDGIAYVLEDLTVKAGPSVWGKVAVDAYLRHEADAIVGETNYGGAMVQHVIKTAAAQRNARVTFRKVTATRGKVVRAEPVSALYDDGKVRHVGYLRDLEDELSGFTTNGYVGDRSPNRADALVWAITELFPSIVAVNRPQIITTDLVIPSVNYWNKRV
jgi:phage terminase large subunit-like protein